MTKHQTRQGKFCFSLCLCFSLIFSFLVFASVFVFFSAFVLSFVLYLLCLCLLCYLYLCLSLYLLVCLCLSFQGAIREKPESKEEARSFIKVSVCLSVCLSICPPAFCISVFCLSVCLSVFLSLCLFLSHCLSPLPSSLYLFCSLAPSFSVLSHSLTPFLLFCHVVKSYGRAPCQTVGCTVITRTSDRFTKDKDGRDDK